MSPEDKLAHEMKMEERAMLVAYIIMRTLELAAPALLLIAALGLLAWRAL